MSIIEFNFEENSKRIWDRLGELADKEVANAFEDEEETGKKGDMQISLAYVMDDEYLGGIVGHIERTYNILKIDGFALDEQARGKGIGTKLIKAIEEIAIAEGCSTAFVETVSFSAPAFYEKRGYSVLGKLDDFPMKGIANYWFYKRL